MTTRQYQQLTGVDKAGNVRFEVGDEFPIKVENSLKHEGVEVADIKVIEGNLGGWQDVNIVSTVDVGKLYVVTLLSMDLAYRLKSSGLKIIGGGTVLYGKEETIRSVLNQEHYEDITDAEALRSGETKLAGLLVTDIYKPGMLHFAHVSTASK